MYNELRATKVLVEIPILQQKMTNYRLKGVDFKNFAKVLDQINREVRQDLRAQDLISEDSHEDLESPRRHHSVEPKKKPFKTARNFHQKSTTEDLFISPKSSNLHQFESQNFAVGLP